LLAHESVEAVPFKERVPALWVEVNKCSALTSNTSAIDWMPKGWGWKQDYWRVKSHWRWALNAS